MENPSALLGAAGQTPDGYVIDAPAPYGAPLAGGRTFGPTMTRSRGEAVTGKSDQAFRARLSASVCGDSPAPHDESTSVRTPSPAQNLVTAFIDPPRSHATAGPPARPVSAGVRYLAADSTRTGNDGREQSGVVRRLPSRPEALTRIMPARHYRMGPSERALRLWRYATNGASL